MPSTQIQSSEIDKYMNAAQSAMFHYQMIEEALKAYIFYAHEIIQSRLPEKISFTYNEAEYASMPLERLLSVFAKFTHNKPLLKQLNALRESRNHVAHRSFALAFLSAVSQRADFGSEFKKVKEASAASLKGFQALKEEVDSISQLSEKCKAGKSVA
jgi:hypothetical protein